MPTMKDIAREAGVSHGTVSNVLNKTGKVSIEKIRLVEAAAKRLGYVPNTQAQLLRQGTPSVVAVIVPSLEEGMYLDLCKAIQTSVAQQDYRTDLFTTDDISSLEEDVLERLRTSGLAAVVAVSCLSAPCCERYRELPCPVLYVDRRPPALREEDAFFTFDYDQAGADLAGHIRREGWRTVACFSPPNPAHQCARLLSRLREALRAESVALHDFSSDYNLTLNTAFDIVRSGVSFDAIVTTGSVRAESIAAALHLCRSSKRPRIITLGTSGAFHGDGVSTYELDYSQLGVKLAQALAASLQGGEPLPKETVFPAKGFPFQFPNIRKQAPRTLTMLTLNTPSTTALEKLLPMFEAISGIHVKVNCISYEDLHAQINLLSPDFSYDLIRMDVAKLDSLGPKAYLPLSEAGISVSGLPKKLIHSTYDNYSQINGVLCALPFDPSVQIFLYRSDLFGNAKIRRAYYERTHEQLTVPSTMDQYMRIAEFFTRECSPESPTRYGATQTTGSSATAASDFLPYFLEKAAGLCGGDRTVRLNTPEMRAAMEQYHRMSRYACQQLWWKDSVYQFASGQAATTVVYSNYAANVIDSRHSNVVGKVGAAIIPGGRPLLGGGVIGISRYCKNLEACGRFFDWFYSPDVASLLVRLGGTSPLVDAYNDFKNFSIFPWLSISRESFVHGTRGVGKAKIPGFSVEKYEFAVGTALRNLTNGIMGVEEAASMAQAIYDSQ